MRLLHTDTLNLEEFIGDDIPRYAILSHRWASPADEPTFRDARKKRLDGKRSGFLKVKNACRVAKDRYRVDYIWIDTCCINKESSAELSEAINSMFAWYKNAVVCLAFLNDVEPGPEDSNHTFEESKWFTRAWTLQELLAPRVVHFFNNAWELIGSKANRSELIGEITNIPSRAINDADCLWKFEIAEKMTWAAGRKATRKEDIAYSLMGLFEVNIPLLYGEGDRAFIRLQEEIIRSTSNISFLRWGIDIPTHRLLADAPSSFQRDTDIESSETDSKSSDTDSESSYTSIVPFTWTNVGLRIETELFRCGIDLYAMTISHETPGVVVAIILRKVHSIEDLYYKVRVVSLPQEYNYLSRTSTITIMRGTKDQRIEDKKPAYFKQDLLRQAYFVEFQPNRNITIQPDILESSYHDPAMRPSWTATSQTTMWEAEFTDPCRWAIASLTCEVAHSSRFRLLFAFDINWQACLLVKRLSTQDQDQDDSLDGTLLLNSDKSSTTTKFAERRGTHWQLAVTRTLESTEERTVYFIQMYKSNRCFAQLPDEFCPENGNVFLCLQRTAADKWTLEVSDRFPSG